MTVAFVLGNGQSRRQLDLQALQKLGKIYGCNALYREFKPDVLIATDTPISEHIQRIEYALNHCFYTRNLIAGLGALKIPEDYFPYSSGPAAVGIAADHGHEQIYLLGFDLGPGPNSTYNNVYADTEFYRPSTAHPVTAVNWIRQLQNIAKKFSNIHFTRVLGSTATYIDQFDSIENINQINQADFDLYINLHGTRTHK